MWSFAQLQLSFERAWGPALKWKKKLGAGTEKRTGSIIATECWRLLMVCAGALSAGLDLIKKS